MVVRLTLDWYAPEHNSPLPPCFRPCHIQDDSDQLAQKPQTQKWKHLPSPPPHQIETIFNFFAY